MLNNKSFFTQLNLALHWYLPQLEADEVREDYRDMQRQAAEAGEVFPPKEDNPLKIARNLSDRREYRRWLLAFGVMLACPLAVGAYLVNYYFPLFDWQNSVFFTQMFFWLGLLAALHWNRHSRRRLPALPRPPRLSAGCAALAVFNLVSLGLAISWTVYIMLVPDYYNMWINGTIMNTYIALVCLPNILYCLAAVLRCRLENRRWLALYVVGITLLLGAMLYLDYLHTMVIEYDLRYEAIDRLKSFILPLLGSLAVNFRILTK